MESPRRGGRSSSRWWEERWSGRSARWRQRPPPAEPRAPAQDRRPPPGSGSGWPAPPPTPSGPPHRWPGPGRPARRSVRWSTPGRRPRWEDRRRSPTATTGGGRVGSPRPTRPGPRPGRGGRRWSPPRPPRRRCPGYSRWPAGPVVRRYPRGGSRRAGRRSGTCRPAPPGRRSGGRERPTCRDHGHCCLASWWGRRTGADAGTTRARAPNRCRRRGRRPNRPSRCRC